MTAPLDNPREFALLCDSEGRVQQILHDGLDLRPRLQQGVSWTKLLDAPNLKKASAFLSSIDMRGSAVGWELNVVFEDRIQLLHFAGTKTREGLLVVGATHPGSSSRYQAVVESYEAEPDKPAWLFEEISRINNEVINMKRDLDKKNAQLTELTAQLEKRIKERTRELESANEKLQQSIVERARAEEKAFQNERLAAVGTTVAKVAHELANPIHSIHAAIELAARLLKQPAMPRDTLTSLIADVQTEFNRLKSLLEELRSSTSKRKLNLEPVDLRALAEQFLRLQAIGYADRRVKIGCDFEDGLPKIIADAEALTQVLLNLCKNALEAMPEGGTLTLRGYRSYENAVLEVVDTGSGIPQDVDLFKPFSTTKAGGMGIGLAIVREIVFDHKGTIAYTSEPGRGTTFRIFLPLNLP